MICVLGKIGSENVSWIKMPLDVVQYSMQLLCACICSIATIHSGAATLLWSIFQSLESLLTMNRFVFIRY